MKDNFPYEIRMAEHHEWEAAIALAWKTFLKYEACDYTPQGIRSFEAFITDQTLYRMFVMGNYPMFVALQENQVVGMITLRSYSHISLLFVEDKFHKQGIGRKLIIELCNYLLRKASILNFQADNQSTKPLEELRVTVNSSPYGVGFYHKVGFKDLGPEIAKDGIRYTPMELLIS